MSDEVDEVEEPQPAEAPEASSAPAEKGSFAPGIPSIADFKPSEQARSTPLAPEPTPLEMTEAIGAGLARGGTLGLSDPLLIAAGLKAERLRELKAKAPLASGLSEFTGGIAPALLTGGESAAARIGSDVALGGAMGAGHEISEEALGDKEFNAEAVLANGLMGGLVGGGTGALLHAVPIAAEPMLNKISSATSDLGDSLQAFSEKLGGNARGQLEKGIGDLNDSLQKVADVQASAGKMFHGADQDGLRYQEQDELLRGASHSEVLPAAQKMIADVEAQVATMAGDNVPNGPLKDVQHVISQLKDEIENSSDPSDLMSAVRDARRELRDVKQATSGTTDYGKSKALGYVNDIDQTLKSHIEDSSVYGPAGAREASVNGTIAHEMDATNELVRNGLARKVKQLGQGAADIEFKPQALRSLAKGLVNATPEAQAKIEAIQDWVESIRAKGAELSKSAASLPGRQTSQDIKDIVLQQAKNLAEIDGNMDRVSELQKALGSSGKGILGSIPGYGFVGGLSSGHPVGALAALSLRGISNPARAIGTLASVSRSASRVSASIARGIGDFMSTNAAHGGGVNLADTIRNQSWSGKRQNSMDDRQEAHSQRRDEILNLASNPENLHNLIVNKTGALSDAAPDIAGLVALKATQGVTHLAGKLPPHGSPADLLPHLDAHHPSHAEVDILERSHRVVTKPLSVLKRMKTGSLTSDEVNTLKTVYPKLYDRMATQMMDKLAALKEPLPYANRLQVATFLGKPTDSSLMPQNLAMLQGNYAIQQPAPPAGKPVRNSTKVSEMKTASAAQTPFQKVAGEAA